MKTKLLFTIIAICFMKFGTNAQTTSVQIIDFMIMPVYSSDTIIQTDSISLNVLFKTDSAMNANRAVLLFGTADETGDIKQVEANYTNISDTTYISYSGIARPIVNYATSITVKLTQLQYDAFSHATLYVEDLNNQQTQHLYFQKQ